MCTVILRFHHQTSTLSQGLRQKGISRGPLKNHLQKTEIIHGLKTMDTESNPWLKNLTQIQ